MTKILTLLVVIFGTNYIQCAKILAIFPMSARSHYILGNSLLRGLAEQGHDVTMISPFTESNPPKNGSYRDFKLTGFEERHDQIMKELDMFGTKKKGFWMMMFMVSQMLNFFLEMTENVLSHPNVQNLLNSDQKFDLVIVEEMKLDALKAFAPHYEAPLVILSTLGANNWINSMVGNPNPLSYVPDFMLGFTSNMSFLQRVVNAIMYMVQATVNTLYTFPKQAQLARKYFPNGPPLNEIVYNTSIVLLNSHISTNAPVPYVPTMIDIGGYHVKPPKKLPSDLQNFLDNAKEGAIYFSLGSNAKSTNMPPEKLQAFLDAFSKLKEKVLYKWEEDNLPNKPANVHTAKWLPQQDILAHPNIKLFITHSGLLSTIETVYHGVPVLAIPIVGDQTLNAQGMVNQGIGLKIDFPDVTEAKLTESINQLLSNPKFARNAKNRSKFFHDRLVDPMKTAVYWIEYVLRHDTSHLRVAGLDLPWYKYHILDVIGFLLVVSLIILYINLKICQKLIRLWRKPRENKLKRS